MYLGWKGSCCLWDDRDDKKYKEETCKKSVNINATVVLAQGRRLCIIAKSVAATGSTRTACCSIVNRLTKIRDFSRDIRSSSDQSSTSAILICISDEKDLCYLCSNCALNRLRSAILNLNVKTTFKNLCSKV